MRFKVHFNENAKEIRISCLTGGAKDIVMPKDTDQHLLFPIPDELRSDIEKYMAELVEPELAREFTNIEKEMTELVERRRAAMRKIREELNPKIMKKCEDFRLDHAEHFI